MGESATVPFIANTAAGGALSPSSPSDPVYVSLDVLGQVIVYHGVHVFDIQASVHKEKEEEK